MRVLVLPFSEIYLLIMTEVHKGKRNQVSVAKRDEMSKGLDSFNSAGQEKPGGEPH